MDFEAYFQRFGFRKPQISHPPHPELGMVVVVPCFNEPDLIASLEALDRCIPPNCHVEIITVINNGMHHPAAVHQRNQETWQKATSWAEEKETNFQYHFLLEAELPKKHAGVGLARKIGMDEAASRLLQVGRSDGLLVCFDADCSCEINYFKALEQHFEEYPKHQAASLHFEHPVIGTGYPEEVYQAIIHYELFLRYYVRGLRWAGHPFAYHTIGSSMVVRTAAYLKQGGMNRRKAGEDFYFLQKLIPLGGFGEITGTKVIPAPRPSDRVPFGTGRAVGQWLDGQRPAWTGYDLRAFQDLKFLLEQVEGLAEPDSESRILESLSNDLQRFLEKRNIRDHLAEIRKNSGSLEAFTQRFFRWFNAFEALKWVHFARDEAYPDRPLTEVAVELLHLMQLEADSEEALDLLCFYRQLDLTLQS